MIKQLQDDMNERTIQQERKLKQKEDDIENLKMTNSASMNWSTVSDTILYVCMHAGTCV